MDIYYTFDLGIKISDYLFLGLIYINILACFMAIFGAILSAIKKKKLLISIKGFNVYGNFAN